MISQALLNAQDRDALSGWGGVVKIMLVTHSFFSYNSHAQLENLFFIKFIIFIINSSQVSRFLNPHSIFSNSRNVNSNFFTQTIFSLNTQPPHVLNKFPSLIYLYFLKYYRLAINLRHCSTIHHFLHREMDKVTTKYLKARMD